MNLTKSGIQKIRDQLHNLDLRDPDSFNLYRQYRQKFVTAGEGSVACVYDDANSTEQPSADKLQGNRTVGVGFNMDRPEARDEWDDCFRGKVDFDQVRGGQRRLTIAQINQLLEYCLDRRANELQDFYGEELWLKLRANERLAIEDAFFCNPGFVVTREDPKRRGKDKENAGGNKPKKNPKKKNVCKFFKHMEQYYETRRCERARLGR